MSGLASELPPLPWHPGIDGDPYGRKVDGWGELADARDVVARIWYPNGAIAEIARLAFGFRLCLVSLDYRYSYENVWCYRSADVAYLAALAWDGDEDAGEPQGWHRHPHSGRRRPDGDAGAEYVAE